MKVNVCQCIKTFKKKKNYSHQWEMLMIALYLLLSFQFFLFLFQVLDEEAEVFIVKMWRLLIYETEAKKIGLVK